MMRSPLFLLGLLAVGARAANREYFVRAELVLWDYGPSGVDRMTGVDFNAHEDADVFMVNRPEKHQIGRQYHKCIYEEYTDGSFAVKKTRASWAGLLGPTLRCEVGDRLAITFQNNCTKALTMHPHGVKYNKHSEGAPYHDGRDVRGDHVEPGETFLYLWTCDEHSGPGPADASSVAWLYHSHNPSRVDSNTGLIGAIVVTARGRADADAKPLDVDREYVLHLSVMDENVNYLLDRNIDDFILAPQNSSMTTAEREALKADEHFAEGNLMHGLNGRLYGNLEGFTMHPGERVRWYVWSLGTEVDLHVMHWKGHSVIYRGQRVTSVQLMAGVSSVADMYPRQVGQWGMSCHVNDHFVGGMVTTYEVVGQSLPAISAGRARMYFIQAEEVIWDYGPSGQTLYGTSLDADTNAEAFFKADAAGGRIGGRYLKCIYREYTDASFTTKKVPSAEWRHLGMLGPVIRGVVGDSVTIVFSNNCSKSASINMPAALKSKSHEGWHYGSALGADPSTSGVVAPGGRHTYEWQIVDGPGPLDLSSVAFIYSSHVEMATDTNSGLLGLLIVTAFGQADETGKPLDVEHEVVALMSATDEGESYLLDANIQKFILQQPGGARTAEEVEALKGDADFVASNVMKGINGLLYGNLEPPQLVAGERTRIYAAAVGTETDLHSVILAGHSFLLRGERRAQMNIAPHDVQEADFIPTAGTWALYCQTTYFFTGGMIAQVAVAPNPSEDPMLVRVAGEGKTRRYYVRAEEVLWDYAVSGLDQTGQYFSRVGRDGALPFEDGDDDGTFMVNDPAQGFIGRRYHKCLFRGYDATFQVPEDRSPGSEWEHLAVLGPIIHAEVGDTILVEFRNNCSFNVSMQPQIAGLLKEQEGFAYQDASGQLPSNGIAAAVPPGGNFTYAWYVHSGPGPRDGSSIGSLYYSMAQGMETDLYTGLKGPLVITRKGSADAQGRPRDVATELVLMFEVTNEAKSALLHRNVQEFVIGRGGQESTDADAFEESNLMHAINGQMYANLRGLTAKAETMVRWYILGLGAEVDIHSVHWHGHTELFAGHRLDTVMAMPGTGITTDMYVDNVGTWLMHCHVNDHIEGGMIATYTVEENPERGEAQISTCQQMYGRSADERRETSEFADNHFQGYQFDVALSPYARVGLTVNFLDQYFDMILAAKTKGWIGIGFFGSLEKKIHPMIDTDMIVGYVKDGEAIIEDRFALGLETPKLDTSLGSLDQLTHKEGFEEGGITYLKFRRSFRWGDLDEHDFLFRSDLEQVQVVYAYSSIESDNLVYHGPTRGYSKLPWNMNCSSNYFFNLRTSECEGCERGFYRLAWDDRFSASRCERCPQGTVADLPGELRTSDACEPCGIAHGTTLFPGAPSHEDCVCQAGYYHPCGEGVGVNGSGYGNEYGDAACSTRGYTKAAMQANADSFCVACPTGMECLGGLQDMGANSLERRHMQPRVPKGYYSPAADQGLSVFKCYDDERRCPGGEPGTCAEGRMGVQCSKCIENWTPAEEGTCRACTGGDAWPWVLCAVVVVGVLCALYHMTASEDKLKKSQSMLLVLISGSQLVTVLQTFGAISVMGIFWPFALARAYGAISIVNFNIEVLRLECAFRPGNVEVLLFKVFLVLALLLSLSLLHVGHVLLFHGGRFQERMPVWISSLGSVLMIFFISITSMVFSPLQCSTQHPNGLATLKAFPDVVCWQDGDHGLMVALALVAGIIPVTFLSIAVWVVVSLPRQMSKGSTAFLRSWAFLLFRFRNGAQWYALAFLGRSTLIALVPAIPEVFLQLITMLLILISSLCLITTVKPWRVAEANVLDAVILAGTVLVVGLSGLFVEGVNKDAVAAFSCVVLICIALLIPCGAAHGLWQKLTHAKGMKPYALVICHHKPSTGAFARLLQLLCSSRQDFRGDVLLDSEGPADIDKLYDLVGHQTRTLVVLCSRSLLLSPICVGELDTARELGVNTVKVVFPDYREPGEHFIGHYASFVLDFHVLAQRGIGLESIQDTLAWSLDLPQMENLGRDTGISMALVQQLSSKLTYVSMGMSSFKVKRSTSQLSGDGTQAETLAETAILADRTNWEAMAVACMLEGLLTGTAQRTTPRTPKTPRLSKETRIRTSARMEPGTVALAPGTTLPNTTTTLLVVCTKGAFLQPEFLRVLLEAAELGTRCLPIWADEGFQSLPMTFVNENQALVEVVTSTPTVLSAAIERLLDQTAVHFDASAGRTTLDQKAGEVAERMQTCERFSGLDVAGKPLASAASRWGLAAQKQAGAGTGAGAGAGTGAGPGAGAGAGAGTNARVSLEVVACG